MAETLVRAHVVVSGRVQGVFFRAEAQREAARLGVSGWVRNTPDGRVEAEFQGSPAAVERALEWVRQGPPRAEVDHVEVEMVPAEAGEGFHVTH